MAEKKKRPIFFRLGFVLGALVAWAGTQLGAYLGMEWVTYTTWAIGGVLILIEGIPFIFKEL